mmetsp:Transcript_36664/g.66279  ORF Transcript_36664/g.66279 Transcript_36664/m.66279 type:complete len:230 (-) Transcript_36664:24-713(-)
MAEGRWSEDLQPTTIAGKDGQGCRTHGGNRRRRRVVVVVIAVVVVSRSLSLAQKVFHGARKGGAPRRHLQLEELLLAARQQSLHSSKLLLQRLHLLGQALLKLAGGCLCLQQLQPQLLRLENRDLALVLGRKRLQQVHLAQALPPARGDPALGVLRAAHQLLQLGVDVPVPGQQQHPQTATRGRDAQPGCSGTLTLPQQPGRLQRQGCQAIQGGVCQGLQDPAAVKAQT